MEVTPALSALIKEKRKALNLSLNDIKTKSGDIVSISTLSAIERGDLVSVKDETFEKITSILQIDITGINTLRIAFGYCAWASVLISAVVNEVNTDENLRFKNLKFTCYNEENGDPVFLTKYNQRLDIKKNHKILTANETLNLLEQDKIDIAFLPIETSERVSGIVRIARSMNTVRGGVYLFVIGKKDKSETVIKNMDVIKETLWNEDKIPQKKCCFVYPLNSIAQYEVNRSLFENTYFKKEAMHITDPEFFLNDIETRVKNFFQEEGSEFFVFVGWDYHIDKLIMKYGEDSNNSEYFGKEYDSYHFAKEDVPIALVSYDCVTKENKADYIRNSSGLKELFQVLSENINILNIMRRSNNNSLYVKITEFLQMDLSFVNKVLKQIHWEFLIYPEMFDKNLK